MTTPAVDRAVERIRRTIGYSRVAIVAIKIMTSKSDKLRAAFLAALMIVSVFGASIALAGTAAAAANIDASNTLVKAGGDITPGDTATSVKIRVDGEVAEDQSANVRIPLKPLSDAGVDISSVTNSDLTVDNFADDAEIVSGESPVLHPGNNTVAVNVSEEGSSVSSDSGALAFDFTIAGLDASGIQDSTVDLEVKVDDRSARGVQSETVTATVDTVGPVITDATAFSNDAPQNDEVVGEDSTGDQLVDIPGAETGLATGDYTAGDTIVEVVFNENVPQFSGSNNPVAGDFSVNLTDGTVVTPEGVADTSTVADPVVLLVLDKDDVSNVKDVEEINVTSGASADFQDDHGNTVSVEANQGISVSTTASTTLAESDSTNGSPEPVFAGETVAFVSQTENEVFEINTDAGNFVFSGTTGTDSLVHYFDTSNRNLSAEYIFSGGSIVSDSALSLRDLRFSAELETDTADDIKDDEPAEVNISAADGGRSVDVELIDDDGDEQATKQVSLDGDGEATATFDASTIGDLDTGTYTMDVTDVDTGISVTTNSFDLGEAADTDASFTQSVYSNERGDVIEFTVELTNSDDAEVSIGSDAGQSDIGYGATFTVVDADDGDDDDDGQVTVQFNTRDQATPTTAEDGDSITNPSMGSLSNVLDVGAYDINVSASGDEDDVATLNLNELSAESFSLYTAPEVDAIQNAENVSEIDSFKEAGNFTESNRIAFGDYLYHEVKASGLGGTFESASGSDDATKLDNILTSESFALNLSIIETDKSKSANSDGKELIDTFDNGNTLDSLENDLSDFHVIADGANDTYYIGIQIESGDDTSEATGVEDEDEYEVTLNITDSDQTRGLVDENISLTQTFTVEDRDVQLDSTTEDADGNDIIEVEAGSGETITGTTSLAPGTEIDVRARATGDTPFLLSQTVETASDRTFEADFDFSDQPVGLEFEVTADGPTNAAGSDETLDAVIVASTATSTPEPTATPTEEPTATPTEEPTATPTEEPTATETPGQPGFGVIVALLAFMAAALLAIRRD